MMSFRYRVYRRTQEYSLRRVAREVRRPVGWLTAWLRGEVEADDEETHRLYLSVRGQLDPGPLPEPEGWGKVERELRWPA